MAVAHFPKFSVVIRLVAGLGGYLVDTGLLNGCVIQKPVEKQGAGLSNQRPGSFQLLLPFGLLIAGR